TLYTESIIPNYIIARYLILKPVGCYLIVQDAELRLGFLMSNIYYSTRPKRCMTKKMREKNRWREGEREREEEREGERGERDREKEREGERGRERKKGRDRERERE